MSPPYLAFIEEQMRLKRFRETTIRRDLAWIKRFILFNPKRHPKDMHNREVERFLSERNKGISHHSNATGA